MDRLLHCSPYQGSLHSATSPKVSNSVFAIEGGKWKQTWNVCLIWSTAHSAKKVSGAFAVIFVTYSIYWLKLLRAHCFRKFRSPNIHAEKSSLRYLGCHSKISRELHAWNTIKDEELNQQLRESGLVVAEFLDFSNLIGQETIPSGQTACFSSWD